MAKIPIIRKGDKTSHGGTVLEGFSNHNLDGIPAAGKGHMVSCPQCKGTFPIIEGVESYKVDGVPVAIENMRTACGATLIASQSNRCIEYTSGGASNAPSSAQAAAADKASQIAAPTDSGICLACLRKAAHLGSSTIIRE